MSNDTLTHPVFSDPAAQSLMDHAAATNDVITTPERVADALVKGWEHGFRPVRSLNWAKIPWTFIEMAAWRSQGYKTVEIITDRIPTHLFETLPYAAAKTARAIPIEDREDQVVLAFADPTDYLAIDDVRSRFKAVNKTVEIVVADANRIVETISEIELKGATENIIVEEDETEDVETFVSLDTEDSDGRIAQLVKNLVMRAAAARASDVHIEPSERGIHVRFRIDGVLHEAANHPLSVGQGIINRLKVMANLDVSERRIPQDGRFGIRLTDRSLDIRLVTIPTVWEIEGAVMRILDQSRQVTNLEALGYSPHILGVYTELCANPHGAIFASGPTGSGKTTSLYASLQMIATPDRKVLTVEDPVEYRMAGITQVQVNNKAGLTFATALRSFLRADPDIMLVGECRDRETAFTAVEAALTGHLVLASLHANTAPSAATRLIEMQIEPFLVASALKGVISQRLLRKLCDNCKQPVPTRAGVFESIEHLIDIPEHVYTRNPDGCGSCSGTGFRGRMAIAEVMSLNDEITRAISNEAAEIELEHLAKEAGLVPIYSDGLYKVVQGLTSIEEVARVAN